MTATRTASPAVRMPGSENGTLPPDVSPALLPHLKDRAMVMKRYDGSSWLYEPKWDGFRSLAFKDNHGVRIRSDPVPAPSRRAGSPKAPLTNG
jgi:ATP-dependent DNA ligase